LQTLLLIGKVLSKIYSVSAFNKDLILATPSTPTIGHRYRLLDQLGAGGMGAVYRAYDRLTGQTVALKRVNVAPEQLLFASRSNATGEALLLALAQEFKILASLRHSHIISVLDYGFDAHRQPYFTMELLDQPQTLLEAGKNQLLDFKVNLLIQTLQALTYLHRRDILHHDLKPENVLISGGQVRVLDFGLAVMHNQSREDDSFGTIFYLPPEIYEGGVYSQAGDMYALGVMAYEMLAGRHPFYGDDVSDFIDRVLTAEPDFSVL
jgi:serine/threonine protein kinase